MRWSHLVPPGGAVLDVACGAGRHTRWFADRDHPVTGVDRSAGEMLRTWQFYVLVFLFVASAQSGLLVIGNAAPILNKTAAHLPFFAANAWLLASFGGFVNAGGRIGTGRYSDAIGRTNAYGLNALVAAVCLFRLKQGVVRVLGVTAAAGVALHLMGAI